MSYDTQQFIEFALKYDVLRFGQFELKSGRISPYFFNIGAIHSGQALRELGQYYASAIVQATLDFDVLFGPAYKGIPLVISTAIALAEHYQKDVPICFNRKETKTHGEQGQLIGAEIQRRVLVIDDVVTAGTAVGEAKTLIEQEGGKVAGLIIAFDRQERAQGESSTITELKKQWHVPVLHLCNLADVLSYLETQDDLSEVIEDIKVYQERYGTLVKK